MARFERGKSGNGKGRAPIPRSLIMTRVNGDIVLFDRASLGQLPSSDLAKLTQLLGKLNPSSILQEAA